MTGRIYPPDIRDDLKAVKRRLAELERGFTSRSVKWEEDGTIVATAGIVVGGSDGPVLLETREVGAPASVTATGGASAQRAYLDVEWTATDAVLPADVAGYEVEISPSSTFASGSRRAQVGPSSLYRRFEPVEVGVGQYARVRAFDPIGRKSPWVDANGGSAETPAGDTTPPGQVANTILAGAGLASVTATWDEVADEDVSNGRGTYEVAIATDSAFTVGYREKRVSGTIASFGDLLPNTAYYVRVRAIDYSGNAGAWRNYGAPTAVTTRQAEEADLQAGVIVADSILVANGAITTAKIGDAQVTSAKIVNLVADKITTGTLTSTVITIGTGGVLRAGLTSSPFHYLTIDDDGIRFYTNGSAAFTGGTLGLEADLSAGTLSLTGGTITAGTLQTAASGQRVSISGSEADRIRFYTGEAEEAAYGFIRGYSTGSGSTRVGIMWLTPPRMGAVGVPAVVLTSPTDNDATGGYVSFATGGTIRVDVTDATTFVYNDLTVYGGAKMRVEANTALEALYVQQDGSGRLATFHDVDAAVDRFAVTKAGQAAFRADNTSSAITVRQDDTGSHIELITSDGTTRSRLNANTTETVLRSNASGGTSLRLLHGSPKLNVRNSQDTAWAPVEGGAYTNSSAQEGKKDLAPAPSALSYLRGCAVWRFRYADEPSSGAKAQPRRWGFLADTSAGEANPNLEGAVRVMTYGDLGVDAVGLTAMLWKAVQELTDRVEALNARQPVGLRLDPLPPVVPA